MWTKNLVWQQIKQESPPAWTKEAYCPPRSKSSLCPRSGGVPRPRSWGYPIPGPGGYPVPGLGCTPSQVRGGVSHPDLVRGVPRVPPSRPGMGYPSPLPRPGMGYLPPPGQTYIIYIVFLKMRTMRTPPPKPDLGWGTPPLPDLGWGTPLDLTGVPPPRDVNWQTNWKQYLPPSFGCRR